MTIPHVLPLIACSMILQVAAAVLAVRLISITGHRATWGLIAAACALSAARRMAPLNLLLSGDTTYLPDTADEAVVFTLSAVMVFGMSRIGPLVLEQKRTEKNQHRTDEALRRMNRELRAVGSCNQALIRASDEHALLSDICRIICKEAGYRMAWVGYADHDESRTIRPIAWAGYEEGYLGKAEMTWADSDRGRGPTGTAIRDGKTVCVQDFETDARMAPWRGETAQRGYRSSISLPLKDENQNIFGALSIYSPERHSLPPDEIRLLEELAADLAFGITVLRTRAKAERAEGMTQARLRMLEAVYAADMTMSDTIRTALDVIEARTDSRIGFYHFMEDDQETLSLQNWSTNTLATMCTAEGKGSHYSISKAGVWVDCVRERRPVIHNDYATLPHRKGTPPGHAPVVRELVVPVMRGEKIVAIVGVGNKPADYDETDVQVVLLLADFSWEFVRRKRAEESLRTLTNELEQRVRLRTAELEEKNSALEAMNKVFIGRELRMVELKGRIRDLEQGRP